MCEVNRSPMTQLGVGSIPAEAGEMTQRRPKRRDGRNAVEGNRGSWQSQASAGQDFGLATEKCQSHWRVQQSGEGCSNGCVTPA